MTGGKQNGRDSHSRSYVSAPFILSRSSGGSAQNPFDDPSLPDGKERALKSKTKESVSPLRLTTTVVKLRGHAHRRAKSHT